jgi:transposase
MKKTSAPHQATPVKVKRRHYQEQFKRDAVAMLQSGRSATQLARELGVSQWNLRDWKELYGAGCAVVSPQARSAAGMNAGAASTVELAVQLADMRRELNAVIAQRDILKKALAIVALDPLSTTR